MMTAEEKRKIIAIIARVKEENVEDIEIDIEDTVELEGRDFHLIEDQEGDGYIFRVGDNDIEIWDSRPSTSWGGRFESSWEEIKKMEVEHL